MSEVPAGYWHSHDLVDIRPMGQCWEIAVYRNNQGDKWARRWPVSKERARNLESWLRHEGARRG